MAHAMVHTYELSIPILVSIWLTEFPVTEADLGLLVTVGMALFGIGALPGGILADRFGSKRLILVCLAGMGLSLAILSAANSIPLIAVSLVLWGAAASVYHPAGLSLISRGVQRRGTGFAFHGMAGNFGIAVGPLVTTILLIWLDWQTVVLILAVPAGVAVFIAITISVDERAAVSADGGSDKPNRRIDSIADFLGQSRHLFASSAALVFLIAIMSGLYYRSVLTFLPELLGEFPSLAPVDVGPLTLEAARYLYVALLMVGIGGQYVGGRLTDRWPVERGVMIGFAGLAAIGVLFLPVAETGLSGLLLASAALGFTLFLVQPLYQAAVAEHSPADIRGLSYGYTYLSVFGIGALGAVIAGTILTYATPGMLFGVIAVFALVGSGTAYVLSVRTPT